MKKLLVLSVMLALASSASAALVVDVDVNGQDWDGSSVKPSDIITVTWIYEGAPANGGISNLDYQVNCAPDLLAFSSDPQGYVLANTLEVVERPDSFSVIGGFSIMGLAPGDLFALEFHVPDVPPSTIIELDASSGGWLGVVDGVAVPGPDDSWPFAAIHVIPEPMTMTLLGLGGLGLLRRRRA